jgi:hypothetical protein
MKGPIIHGRPVSRRDFISRGLMAGGATVLAPTIGTFWMRDAFADIAPLAVNAPFMVFDCAGGASLPANFLVGKPGGPKDYLNSYNMLGWNPKAAGALDERFGLPMGPGTVSKIMAGMLEFVSVEAQKNFRFGSFCHTGQIDTSSNPLSAMSLAALSGAKGTDVSSPVGLVNSLSGGNSRYALESATYKAMSVQKLDDLLNAVGLGGALNGLPDPSKEVLGRLVKRLSMAQATKLLNQPVDDEMLKILGGRYDGVAAKVKAASGLDPRKDPIFQTLYGLNDNSDPSSETVLRAAVTMGVLKGITGPGVITIDGCDYHTGDQITGDNKDQEIGREIGRAIQAAFQLKVPLFIQIITDGGCYPKENTRMWDGDSVDKCMSVIGCFNPTAPVTYYQNRMQVGAFTDGQGADRGTTIGDSPQLAAYAAFANYLNVCGRLKEFQTLAPGIFDDKTLESVIMFQGQV